jgi:hypothetical protein
VDKQKEVCTNVPVEGRDAGRNFGFEAEPVVVAGGPGGGEKMDASSRSENRVLCEDGTGVRGIMSAMYAKNPEIGVLIEKLKLEIR